MAILLTFLVGIPLNLAITYMVYQYIHAPSAVWTLWIIQMPVMIVIQILLEISKNIKE